MIHWNRREDDRGFQSQHIRQGALTFVFLARPLICLTLLQREEEGSSTWVTLLLPTVSLLSICAKTNPLPILLLANPWLGVPCTCSRWWRWHTAGARTSYTHRHINKMKSESMFLQLQYSTRTLCYKTRINPFPRPPSARQPVSDEIHPRLNT